MQKELTSPFLTAGTRAGRADDTAQGSCAGQLRLRLTPPACSCQQKSNADGSGVDAEQKELCE